MIPYTVRTLTTTQESCVVIVAVVVVKSSFGGNYAQKEKQNSVCSFEFKFYNVYN